MIQIIITGKDKEKVMGWFDSTEYQAIGRKLDKILIALAKMEKTDMATKDEVKADLANIIALATETRGVANTAVVLIKKLFDQINNAAATAADLDEFRATLKTIMTETQAAEDDLKAAVTTNQQA
jgi:hypothetical protein